MAVDISGVVLQKILLEPNVSLDIWPKLKLSFFGTEYTSIYAEINKYYIKFSKLPSFSEIEISVRNPLIKSNLAALRTLEAPTDIDLDIAYEALLNQYTQNEALEKIDILLDTITLLDTSEIISQMSDIVMYLEEKTHTSEEIYLMSDLILVDKEEISSRIMLGLNNTHDAEVGGFGTDDLILIGGGVGQGKSVLACNIAINQYLQGNVVPYFTIEMRARSVYTRIMSALAGVDAQDLGNGRSSSADLAKLVRVRAEMFVNSADALNNFYNSNDYNKFEADIAKLSLKADNQIIIIDNQRLSLSDIDLNIHKLKAQFGDKLKVVVIDYLNAIDIEDIYSWEAQLSISKALKDYAEKYNVLVVAPYQINKSGEARFSKGILDKADVAVTLKANKDSIEFESTKTRNMPAFKHASNMDWSSLRLLGTDAVLDSDDEEDDDSKPKVKKNNEDLGF